MGDGLPRILRAEQHAVGDAGRAARGCLALSRDLDGRVRLLERTEAHFRLRDAGVLALKGDLLARPELLHEGDGLLHLARAILSRQADRLELDLAIADSHPQGEPSVAEVVECGCVL